MTDLEKWIEAALTVADTTCMKDSEIIPTWPSDVAGFYPTLTIGALREWQVSQAKQNPDYRTVANRAIGDIARVTELLGVPEEEAGRPIVELVQEFLEARAQEGGGAVARIDRTKANTHFTPMVENAHNLPEGVYYCYTHPPQSQGVPEGLEIAARHIERKADNYDQDHGTTDPSTGSREYPGDGAEYYAEMMELAEEVRALSTPTTPGSCQHGVRLPHLCSECENDVENDPEYRKKGGK